MGVDPFGTTILGMVKLPKPAVPLAPVTLKDIIVTAVDWLVVMVRLLIWLVVMLPLMARLMVVPLSV